MNKGQVFIVSGASGTGKDTLLEKLFKANPEIEFSISTITRPMRPGEVEGKKYHFISVPEFEKLLSEDAFLEHNCFVGNYYGTPKQPVIDAVDNGKNIILEVDVNGAEQIRKKLPNAVSVFIMPPSYSELKRRLIGRGTDSDEVIEQRLKIALSEIKRAKEYDYIIVNDDIDKAVNDFLSVIYSQQFSLERQTDFINEVLEKC